METGGPHWEPRRLVSFQSGISGSPHVQGVLSSLPERGGGGRLFYLVPSSKLRVTLVFSVHPLISGIPWFYERRLSMCTVQSAELCSEESWGLLWGLSLKALLEPPPSG